jgi:hypothetical protein
MSHFQFEDYCKHLEMPHRWPISTSLYFYVACFDMNIYQGARCCQLYVFYMSNMYLLEGNINVATLSKFDM